MDDAQQKAITTDDDGLGGDLELEPADAEQVVGGIAFVCPACSHHHSQTDPKCNFACGHGSSGPGGGFY